MHSKHHQSSLRTSIVWGLLPFRQRPHAADASEWSLQSLAKSAACGRRKAADYERHNTFQVFITNAADVRPTLRPTMNRPTKRLWVRLYPHTILPNYSSLLQKFDIVSLELCRIRSDLVLFFNIFRKLWSTPSLLIYISYNCNYSVAVSFMRSKISRRFFLHLASMI